MRYHASNTLSCLPYHLENIRASQGDKKTTSNEVTKGEKILGLGLFRNIKPDVIYN